MVLRLEGKGERVGVVGGARRRWIRVLGGGFRLWGIGVVVLRLESLISCRLLVLAYEKNSQGGSSANRLLVL